ncbi:SCP2 domain-containing protein [Rugamonas sp. CCM 8940]|uniref:ubiquinone anaerobic biosynthesis accessory factor UbiT n=1 Tax=Rugamonas sp. CCM 8940 TaxID=2765359 RepID=UPI0018F6ACAC|nr:SCP2 sterol-binding domain-containing protein [Rugamonas sp. CCM 8940]MBJ7312237.1 SCP2 sterol-binding domain-containing protein [Rugamonas sp. CCM 8940]
MTSAVATVPAALAAVLSKLPAYPGSLLFVGALNLALRRHLPDDVRQSLQGKRMRISVRDAGLAFDFSWDGDRFCACQRGAAVDLVVGASARDFLALARREEDPDTLFFCRRLSMEGDTELGLLVKNTLDAIDAPLLELPPLPAPLRWLAARARHLNQ